MNFSKSLLKIFPFCYKKNKSFIRQNYSQLSIYATINYSSLFSKPHADKNFKSKHFASESNSLEYDNEQETKTDLYPYTENETKFQLEHLWTHLFPNDIDPTSNILIKCASVEEILAFVKEHSEDLNDKRLTQIILTMSNLQTVFFYHMDDETARRNYFFKKLLEYKEFYTVLKGIEDKLNCYNPLYLSYTIYHLCKLGIPIENNFIQSIAIQLKNHIEQNFCLETSANLFKTIFLENSVRPYYIVINLIPVVLQHIDKVNYHELEYLTICLIKLSNILKYDVLESFESKVNEFIETKVLSKTDSRTILKIILLFNYPRWRNYHSEFISKCILLMDDHINKLNFTELEHVHEVLFRNEEPGDALNTIQRCSAKFLQQLEDTQTHRDSRLKLFSCLIFFSSPINTIQFRLDLHKYLNDKDTIDSLFILRRLYRYLKISDVKLCEMYWNKACHILKRSKDLNTVLKLADTYVKFTSTNTKYRHYTFEHHILQLMEKYFNEGFLFRTAHFFTCFNFALLYCKDRRFFMNVFNSFRENFHKQLSANICLKLSQTIGLLHTIRNPGVNMYKDEINTFLLNATKKIFWNRRNNLSNLIIVKAAILRNDSEHDVINDILNTTKDISRMSSKTVESICFNLGQTDYLIPETINKCSEYVVRNKGNILAFNGEKLLNLCYYLNYYPLYAEEFFQTITDILIRDQERISGLTFLQAALALGYFNRMPKSFVKQIFNVEFLDKLDIELAHCYFKESYPYRVRYILMQLNRLMCLENPEYNIPWFHQKFIEEYQKSLAIDDASNKCQMKIKEYMFNIVPKQCVLENFRIPYGYRANFIIHLDQDNKPTLNFDDPQTRKLALLIKYSRSYTKNCIQLKGQDQLKNRHLEILGYKVKIIKWDEFFNLLYGSERIEFIKNKIFS